MTTTDFSSPGLEFWFDLNKSPFFRLDGNNFINVLGARQLNSLLNTSLLDIFLSKGHIIEPHYHPNAAELIYCITGAATVSILNPFTRRILDFQITPGQAVNVPRGWWHYEIATADGTHLLAVFDAPNPEVILGSDLLSLTPSGIVAYTYGLDEGEWKKAVAPVKPGLIIGPRSAGEQQMQAGNGCMPWPEPFQPWPHGQHPWAYGQQPQTGYPAPGWPGYSGMY